MSRKPPVLGDFRRIVVKVGSALVVDAGAGRLNQARLASRGATMVSADLLVLRSDVDGLYDGPPAENPDAKRIPLVAKITAEIEAMAGAPGSDLSRGGMQTKIEAGKIATAAGAHMVIAPGAVDNPLQAIAAGGPCTWFLAPGNPVTARKKWIAGSLEPRGNLFIHRG